jgi:serine/threonine protein kinase
MVNTLELTEDGAVRSHREGAAVDPMLGRRLLHYRVEERIGQGGMSVVYRGVDERLNRDVAIKVLHPFLAEKIDCRARLAREARAVARLEHENILRIFDFSGDPATLDERPGDDTVSGEPGSQLPQGVHSEEGFLVTELVPGTTLKMYAEDHQLSRVPEVGALIVWQLARALQHAHQQGVVHRDLKPENVMVRDDGVLKLMDFGIAQVVDSKSLTVTGTLLGSPAHMAPECIEGMHADGRSDIFSLGTVLYSLMCGALPFEAISPHALLKAIVDGRYAPPQQKQPRVSDALAKVVRRTLATRPDDRYQTAGALADALAEALGTGGVDASAKSVVDVLADPDQTFPHLADSVRRATLNRAAALIEEGQPTKALGALGRVLAEHPHDDEAQALIERAHSLGDDDIDEDDDDDEALVSPPPIAVADDGVTSVTRELPSTDVALPRPVSTGVYAQRLGLVAVAAAMITLVVVVADRVPNEPVALTDPEPAATPEPDMSMMPDGKRVDGKRVDGKRVDGKRVDGQRPDDQQGGSAGRDDKGPDAASADARKPPRGAAHRDGSRPGEPRDKPSTGSGTKPNEGKKGPTQVASADPGAVAGTDAAKPPTQGDPEAAIAGPVVRKVLVKANAYGEVVIDGTEKKTVNPLRINELALEVGPHRLIFTHPAANNVEKKLDVTADGPPPRIEVVFAPKPAGLVVDSDVPDAYVTVKPLVEGGKEAIVGQVRDSQRRPFPIRFPPDPAGRLVGKMSFKVTATHQDRMVTRTVDLRAGASKSITLDLSP